MEVAISGRMVKLRAKTTEAIKKIPFNLGLVVPHTMYFAYLLWNCHIHEQYLGIAVIWFMVTVFCVLLPGFVALELLHISSLNNMQRLAYSYGLGYVIILAEYFLTMPMGISSFAPYLNIIITVGCIFYHVRHKRSRLSLYMADRKSQLDAVVASIAFFFMLLIIYNCASLVYTLPNESVRGNAYHSDFIRSVGTNITAQYGFPLQDFFQIGTVYRYHYLFSIFVAQLSIITKIDCLIVSFFLYSPLSMLFLIYSLYALFSEASGNALLQGLSYAIFIITENLLWHVYCCPFGFEGALCMGMLAVYVALRLLENFSWQETFTSFCFIAVCAGFKAPLCATILIGCAMCSLLLWIIGKSSQCYFNKLAGVIYGFSCVASFLCVYLTFVKGRYSEAGTVKYIGLSHCIEGSRWVRTVYDTMPDWLPEMLRKVATVFLYHLSFNRVAGLLFLISVVVMIIMLVRKRYGSDLNTMLILNCISLFGSYAGIALVHPGGGSQTYFSMLTVPFEIVAGMISARVVYGYIMTNRKRFYSVLGILLLLIMMYACRAEWRHWYGRYAKRANAGVAIRNGGVYWHPTGHYCNPSQYEAYRWLRENSEPRDVIAIDNFGSSKEYNFQIFVSGVFSERYVWNAGYYAVADDPVVTNRRNEIISKIDKIDNSTADILYAAGIKYFLQNKQYSEEVLKMSDRTEVVFDNESYRIYSIK